MQYDNEIALGVLASLVGVGLAIRGFSGTTSSGGPGPKPGETLNIQVNKSQFSPLSVSVSDPNAEITLTNPQVQYAGPGRNTYTYFEVRQGNVRVMASGIAGVHVGPASTPTIFPLVASDQIQPCSAPPAPILTALPWKPSPQEWPPCGEPFTVPLCGAPPDPSKGPGDIYVMIFQDSTESGQAVDADGFSSPSCNPARVPIQTWTLTGAVTFTG